MSQFKSPFNQEHIRYPQQPAPLVYQPTMPDLPAYRLQKKPPTLKWFVIGICIVTIAIIGAIALASHPSLSSSISSSAPSSSGNTVIDQLAATERASSSSSSASSTSTYHLPGEVVQVESWNVIVGQGQIHQSAGDLPPPSGNVYLVLPVVLKNITTVTQTAFYSWWSLRDNSGFSFDSTYLFGHQPDGDVAPNDQISGWVAFVVPPTTQSFILQYAPDFGNSGLAQWQITV